METGDFYIYRNDRYFGESMPVFVKESGDGYVVACRVYDLDNPSCVTVPIRYECSVFDGLFKRLSLTEFRVSEYNRVFAGAKARYLSSLVEPKRRKKMYKKHLFDVFKDELVGVLMESECLTYEIDGVLLRTRIIDIDIDGFLTDFTSIERNFLLDEVADMVKQRKAGETGEEEMKYENDFRPKRDVVQYTLFDF